MASRIELLQEARRRGLPIDPQDGELLAEAERRGLVPTSKADFSGVRARVDSTEANPDSAGMRDVKMGLRSVMQGAGGLVGALGGDAFNHYVVDPLDRAFNTPEPTLGGLVNGQPRGPAPSPTYRDAAGALADRIGLPRPQTSQERVMGDIGEGLTGTGLTMGVGGLLNLGRSALSTAAPSIAQRTGNFLTAQPLLQTISTVTGSGAASIARENGVGGGGQIAAGLLGGLSPAIVSAGVPAITRGLLRGSSADKVAQNISDFAAAGTTPTLGQSTQGWLPRASESILAKFPGGAGVIARKSAKQGEEIGQGVEKIAATLTPKATAEQAGKKILKGVTGEGGFLERTRQVGNELYAKLDAAIPAQTRIEVGNTQKALAELNAPIPGAPEVSKQFQNARISGIEKGLASDTGSTQAVLSRPGVRADAEMLRNGLLKDRAAAEARNEERRSLGVAALEPVPPIGQIDAQVDEYLAGLVDNRLPYEALKKLRTVVGAELENASLVSDVPRSKWKALYGALSKDLETAAASNPEAKQAWARANRHYNYRMKRIDAIEHVIDKSGGPEAVFNAAFSGTKDGATTLRAVMQSLPKDGQKELSAAFVRRLGRAVNSQQNDTGEVFSTQTFLTNWNKVSPEAKKVLLDRHGMAFSRDMDKIARVAANLREGSEIYKNPAGTGVALQQGATAGSFLLSFLTGRLDVALGIAGMVGGSWSAAKLMTNPRVVAALARSTEAPVGTLPAQLQTLRQIADNEDDKELHAFVDAAERASKESGRHGE